MMGWSDGPFFFCPTCLGREFRTRLEVQYDMTGIINASGKVQHVLFDGTEVQTRASRRSFIQYPEPPVCTSCGNPVLVKRPSASEKFRTTIENAYKVAPDSVLETIMHAPDLSKFEKNLIKSIQKWRLDFRRKYGKMPTTQLKVSILQSDIDDDQRRMLSVLIKERSEDGADRVKGKPVRRRLLCTQE